MLIYSIIVSFSSGRSVINNKSVTKEEVCIYRRRILNYRLIHESVRVFVSQFNPVFTSETLSAPPPPGNQESQGEPETVDLKRASPDLPGPSPGAGLV